MCGRTSSTRPVTSTPGSSASRCTAGVGARPTIDSVTSGSSCADAAAGCRGRRTASRLRSAASPSSREDQVRAAARRARAPARSTSVSTPVGTTCDRRAQRAGIEPRERVAVGVGHGEHAVEARRASRASKRSIRRHCCADRAARRPGCVAFSAWRRQISASTLCVKSTAGQGSAVGQVDRRNEEVADDQVEAPFVEQLDRRVARMRAERYFADRIRQRIDEVARGVGVEAQRALRRVACAGSVTSSRTPRACPRRSAAG